MFLSQHKYTTKILKSTKMESCNPVATPTDTNSKLSATGGDSIQDVSNYRQLASALQYLTFTRPDIAYVVQQICLFMHALWKPHLNALKRIVRYLKGTQKSWFTLKQIHTFSTHCLYRCRLGWLSRHSSIYFRILCLYRRQYVLVR